jgi:O-antigen/teichoic acid export membrane protein
VASKVVSAILQIVMIPFAITHIGTSGYAAYTSLIAIASIPVLFMLNFGPRLVAEYSSNRSDERAKGLLCTTLKASTTNALLLVVVLGVWLFISPFSYEPESIAGLGKSTQKVSILLTAGCLIFGIILSTLEAIQVAKNQHYRLSVSSLIGSIASIAGLYVFLPTYPSPTTLIVCIMLPTLLARAINSLPTAIRVLKSDLDTRKPNTLVSDGVKFTVASSVAAYLSNQMPVLLFASLGLINESIIFAALIVALGALLQPVNIMMQPLIPLFTRANNNESTISPNTVLGYLSISIVIYTTIIVIALHFCGEVFFTNWLRGIVVSKQVALSFAFYFSATALEAILFSISISLPKSTAVYKMFGQRVIFTVAAAVAAAMMQSLVIFYVGAAIASYLLFVLPAFLHLSNQRKSPSVATTTN